MGDTVEVTWRRTLSLYLAYREARDHNDAPATEADIEQAQALAQDLVGHPLPSDVVELWREVAGLDFNGTVIFAPRERPAPAFLAGLVETNTELPAPAPYLHLGTYGDEFLSWNSADGSYAMIDRLSHAPLPTFTTFDELIEEHFGRLVTWAAKRAPHLLRAD